MTAAKTNTVYIDLDAVKPDKEIVVKLDGVDHPVEPITVEQFVENMQTMERLGLGNLSAKEEKDLMVQMLVQTLPSIGADRLNKLQLIQLNALIEFTRKYNGETKVADEVKKETTENPPEGE